MTDAGQFEKLAASVLRASNPVYRTLTHTGLNEDGRTVRSPVDGICYLVDGAVPRQYIVHHTTTARAGLRDKWLRAGTSTRDPRRGDVAKAVDVAREARSKIPRLVTTLVLTTNQEPDLSLVTDLTAVAHAAGLDLDLWPASRLAYVLDATADGQWIRNRYLGDEPDLLSREMLQQLSGESLTRNLPRDSPDVWVERSLDKMLVGEAKWPTTFIVAASGLGKSVACYKWLADHHKQGAPTLVLPHQIIAQSPTLPDAICATLQQMMPSLGVTAGSDALGFASPDAPIYLVVEDINRSGQAAALAERIEGWSRTSADKPRVFPFRLLCPIWPDVLSALSEQSRRSVLGQSVFGGPLTSLEAREAVQKRALAAGRAVSEITAEATATALGNDPLLIALADLSKPGSTTNVIGDFVESAISRVAVTKRDYPAGAYLQSLRALAAGSLRARKFDPEWEELRQWAELAQDDLIRLAHLTHDGAAIHLDGPSLNQRIGFRHDRVRDWLLVDAACVLDLSGTLSDDVISEPFFAEIVGRVVARRASILERAAERNPLALFYALRTLAEPRAEPYEDVLRAIQVWLDSPMSRDAAHLQLRWDALAVLAQTDSADVIGLVDRIDQRSWSSWQALLRNGDLRGGIALCDRLEPKISATWRDILVEHAKHTFGPALITKLVALLRNRDLPSPDRIAAVRLAGYIADPALGAGIMASWDVQENKDKHVDDYLLAAARCCGDNAASLLTPICDHWALLPEKGEEKYCAPRYDVANLKWAFAHNVPHPALAYLIQRAKDERLRLAILHLLDAVDDPTVILFVTEEMAHYSRIAEANGSHSIVSSMITSHWQQTEDRGGKRMSDASRGALQDVWTNVTSDPDTRRSAFFLWAATVAPQDLALLRNPALPPDLADDIFDQRLRRGDKTAVPALVAGLKTTKHPWWSWHRMHDVWCEDLLPVLEAELASRATSLAQETVPSDNPLDYILAQLLEDIPIESAEPILLKHWDDLRRLDHFILAAIVIGTPTLRDLEKVAVASHSDRAVLLKHLNIHIGLKHSDRAGITREAQIVSLSDYLEYLHRHDVKEMYDICTRNGWKHVRHECLEPFLRSTGGILFVDEAPTYAALDDMVEKGHIVWVDHWLKDYAESGATMDAIMALVGAWFRERATPEARKLLHEILRHSGRRSDLAMLDFANPDTPDERAHRANTEFAVYRRGLV